MKLLLLLQVLGMMVATPTLAAWRVDEDRDRITDRVSVFAYTRAIDSNVRATDDPMLILRCRAGRTEVYLETGTYLGFGDVMTTYRIDNRPSVRRGFPVGSGGKSIFLPDAIRTIRSMMDSSRLLMRLQPYHRDGSIELEFDISGLREAIPPLQRACGWR